MLYNTAWEKPADVFSLESLIAWLEQMPPRKRYDWHNCGGKCLLAQFVISQGTANWEVDYFNIPSRIRYSVASEGPYTFGAALERARAALASPT